MSSHPYLELVHYIQAWIKQHGTRCIRSNFKNSLTISQKTQCPWPDKLFYNKPTQEQDHKIQQLLGMTLKKW
jgi:hypothetical protein